MPFEVHPDTPDEGVLLAEYFKGMDVASFFQKLDKRGQSMNVRFNYQPVMSNSRMALEAGEFAKEEGKYREFHEEVFKAYFTHCENLGDLDVLLRIASKIGLEDEKLKRVLEDGHYSDRLAQTTRQAKEIGVTAAPTFIIDGYDGVITGAQPLETFRSTLQQVAG